VAISVVCEIALSLPLLAMTKGMRHCQPFLIVIANPSLLSLRAEGVAISGKAKLKNQKAK